MRVIRILYHIGRTGRTGCFCKQRSGSLEGRGCQSHEAGHLIFIIIKILGDLWLEILNNFLFNLMFGNYHRQEESRAV